MTEAKILFERDPYWVCAATSFKGFEVWRCGATHSVRVARIGYEGEVGMEKAKAEIQRRLNVETI